MKTPTCNTTFVTKESGEIILSPTYCLGTDCKLYPCRHIKKLRSSAAALDKAQSQL